MAREDVTVVRTGPDPDRLRRGAPNPDWRRGRTYLCAYLGVMGPQDGVDLALRAAAELARAGRDDIQFVFMGKGDSTDELVELAEQLGIADIGHVHRAGSRTRSSSEVLSTADLGLCPDPAQPSERRLDDEQDDGVHGVRASGRRVRPEGDAGLRRRRRRRTSSRTTSPRTRARSASFSTIPSADGRWVETGTAARRRRPRVAPSGAALRRRVRAALERAPQAGDALPHEPT